MERLEKARAQLDREAIEFLKGGLYAEDPDDCPRYVHFAISANDAKRWRDEYQEGVRCFRALFRSGEERFRLALWNMIANYYMTDSQFLKEDFSEEEYGFIQAALQASGRSIESANVNKPIKTKRLVLRAIEEKDLKVLVAHCKSEGDFTFFTGRKPTRENVWEFAWSLVRNAYFAIEQRSDGKLIGYIGLSIKDMTATGLLEYYLFKEERRKGYCTEAVEALAKIAAKGKLYMPAERVQRGVYGKRTIRLNAIRARIASDNTASRKAVERCGFVHEATIHRALRLGKEWSDVEIYYLTGEML